MIQKRARVIRGLLMNIFLNPFAQKQLDDKFNFSSFYEPRNLEYQSGDLLNRFYAILTSHLDFPTHSTVNEPKTSRV